MNANTQVLELAGGLIGYRITVHHGRHGLFGFPVGHLPLAVDDGLPYLPLPSEGVQSLAAPTRRFSKFLRSTGKFHYKNDNTYAVGTIGFQDVDCDFIDFTYVALEFYQRKRGRWPFATESIPWEVWTLRVNVVSLNNEHERQIWREKVGESLGERLLRITDTLNRHDYIPSPPNQSDIDYIYDTNFPDVQPFLFKVNYTVSAPSNPSTTTTIKKLLKDTLAL